MRDAYIVNEGTPKEMTPFKTNRIMGMRNRREFWRYIGQSPAKPG